MTKERIKEILEEAKKDFGNNMNHIDFHNKYFGTRNEYVPKDRKERTEFLKSDEVSEIMNMVFKLEEKQPTVKLPSGKINLRISRTMHQNLKEIAEKEGTSLNQLMNNFLSEKIGEYFLTYRIEKFS